MVDTTHVKKIGIAVVVALSQIINALSSNSTRCEELLDCLEIIAGVPIDFGGAGNKDEFCNALLFFYNGIEGVTAMCNVASLISEPFAFGIYDDNSTETSIFAAPTCLAKARAIFPDASGDFTGYDGAVASVVGTFILAGKDTYTDADAVGNFLIGYFAAKTAAAVASGCELTLGSEACGAARLATNVPLAALDIVFGQISFQDSLIDSSHIQATFTNVNAILDQTCSMIDQTQSLEDNMTTRFNAVDGKLEEAIAKLDQANAKLDELLCPFGTGGATFTALRQGCDAIDQDCNGVVDECAEDKVPPSLILQTPIPDKSFKSTDEARQFLQENIIASDDCAAEFQTEIQLQNGPDCCDCVFRVTTADVRCVNENAPGRATADKTFIVKVDSAAPVINCGFFVQQDPFHVLGGFDPCGGLPAPFPGVNDLLHIDKSSVGQGLFDVGLWYQIDVSAVLRRNHTPTSFSEYEHISLLSLHPSSQG